MTTEERIRQLEREQRHLVALARSQYGQAVAESERLAKLKHERREAEIAKRFVDQAKTAALVAKQLDCGVDRRERALLREQWMLKGIVGEER